MNGGLAVIADLPKMMVYRVSRWRNRRKADIPEAILTKAPSAELRPGQTDQDSLPPYELLDQILELHVEQSKSAEEIVARGFDEATVRRVVKLVRNAEFKRKQAAPVLKVTSRAFGTGWRMPIARGGYTPEAVSAPLPPKYVAYSRVSPSRTEFEQESVAGAGIRQLDRAGGNRKVGGIGVAGDVYRAAGIQGDGIADVDTGAAHVSAEQKGARGVKLGDEDVGETL
jgi:hypothetical protein